MSTLLKSHVDGLFADAAPSRGHLCRNPVVGGEWVVGADPVEPQKQIAQRALVAREWFAIYGPPDAPLLPLDGPDQGYLRYHEPFQHLVAEYARSLAANKWEFHRHPSFEDFARGALASEYSPKFTRENAALLKRFPPCPLPGLGPGQIWSPIKAN